MPTAMHAEITRAGSREARIAFALLREYFEAVKVVLREDHAKFLEEYFGQGRGFWLARVAGHMAGCVGLRALSDSQEQVPDKKCAEIKRMYVRPEYRGRGIAQQLLRTTEDFARNAGYAWIYLDTASEMKAAARLYRQSGFLLCERYNQNPQAAIFMRKRL